VNVTATQDLFTPIHKGLRSMLYGLSGRLQTNDFADLTATESLVDYLENDFAVARSAGCTLCMLSQHANDEETAIFPDTAKAGNELITGLIEEHHDLARREASIAQSAHALLAIEDPLGRAEAGVRLNQSANELFAAYLAHMNREENDLVPWMKEHFSDAQMAAMRGAILGRTPPDRMSAILGWMLPSLNVRELSGLIGEVRSAMPPPAFKAITDLCEARVDPARWDMVRKTLGI
jgi:hypothetical protein